MANAEEIKAILDKFQDTLEKWPLDGGLFLDLMHQKLQQIQQQFAQEISNQLPNNILQNNPDTTSTPSDQTEVYVELYQIEGDNLERWALMLNALGVQGISRPIYQTEAGVCNMIRSKAQKNREAYVVVKVPNSSIIKTPQPLLDSGDRTLVQLKTDALKPKNIVRFVHISGQYLWQYGKLIKLDLPSPIREKAFLDM